MSTETWSVEAAEAELAPFHSDSALVLVALQRLQERFGFIRDEDVAIIARTCNVSRADVHGVLTFYTDLRTSPPARRQVRVCRAEACQATGSRAIEAAFAEAGHPIGSHTEQVSVEAVYCLGNCALGPAVEVDGILRARCDASIVAEALR